MKDKREPAFINFKSVSRAESGMLTERVVTKVRVLKELKCL